MLVRFFSNATATTAIYTLSLHDALPICIHRWPTCGSSETGATPHSAVGVPSLSRAAQIWALQAQVCNRRSIDRKSTRLNSSHRCISYAVFCLKKKNKQHEAVLRIREEDS